MASFSASEDFETELGEEMSMLNLDGESEDNDEPLGDGTQLDGCQLLLKSEVLALNSGALSLSLFTPSPAERDSILLLDPELIQTSGNHIKQAM